MSKLAIIGAGNIVNAHLDAAMHVGFEPVAIVARNNSKSVYKYSEQISGLNPCANLNELLTYEFDAFLVATSEGSKADILNKIIPLGKPILVEKPVTSIDNIGTLEKTDNLELVKVAYNRRNYSSVDKLKSELIKVQHGVIQINIPELSWISNPSKELVNEMAFTNSIHMIDLLNYLLPHHNITHISEGKNESKHNRIISFEDEKFIGTINLTFGTPDTYSFKISSDSRVLELAPIETFKSFNKISKVENAKNAIYEKISDSHWEISEDDKNFKPGFVRQYSEFSKFILNHSGKVNLATISDDNKAFHVMRRIMVGN